MRRFLLWLILAAVVIVAGAAVYLIWDTDCRWRPKTVTRDQAEIAKALEGADWVSPHLTGPRLYAVVYRGCDACNQMEAALFQKLQAADVDTRVIVVALPDLNGQSRSTPAERATVAELWTNRSWKLFQQWSLADPARWTAPNIPPADGDALRTAAVQLGRDLVTRLTPLLKKNGVPAGYPLLVWWTKPGELHATVADDPRSYRFVENELTAP